MDSRTKAFLTFFILVVAIAGLYIFSDWFSKATGYALGEDQKIKFAQCLNEKASTLYITSNCPDCEKQQVLLGENAYAIVNKIECGEDLCRGLKSVPAWEIEGKFYYGTKNWKELDEISMCNIEPN